MAVLPIPTAIYDYILYYECAEKDWADKSAKSYVGKKPAGFLINSINWGTTSTTVKGDSGGATKCGIIKTTWAEWYSRNAKAYGLTCGPDINKMDLKGWKSLISSWWAEGPGLAANLACAVVLFQARWVGWGDKTSPGPNKTLQILKSSADKKDYQFKTKGGIYARLADATHAYSNPMNAYKILRENHIQYLYNVSAPGNSNNQFRVGWMRREVAPFQPDGLYVEPGSKSYSSNSKFTINQWEQFFASKKGKGSYVMIYPWDTPLQEEFVTADKEPYYDQDGVKMFASNNNGTPTPFSAAGGEDINKQKDFKGILLGANLKQK